MTKIIITRHPALADYLREQGLVGDGVEVLTHASVEDVRGRHVYGVLPLFLAAEAARVTEIPLALTPEMRGKELDIETLRKIAEEPVTYVVTKEDD